MARGTAALRSSSLPRVGPPDRKGRISSASPNDFGLAPAQLIILDLMPRMEGIEFRLRQREDPSLAAIPTVLVTAVDPLRVQAVQLERAACVRKPLDTRDLLALVRRLVGERAEPSERTH